MTNDVPICQFGPGGDYVQAWPRQTRPVTLSQDEIAALMARPQAADQVQQADGGCETATSLQQAGSEKLECMLEQAAKIAWRAVSEIGEKTRCLAVAVIRKLGRNNAKVILKRSAAASELGLSAISTGVCVPTVDIKMEQDHGNSHTETIRDPADHPRLPQAQRLFSDDAGDWRPPKPNEGDRVRARHSPGKKRSTPARSKAQGSLFADFN